MRRDQFPNARNAITTTYRTSESRRLHVVERAGLIQA